MSSVTYLPCVVAVLGGEVGHVALERRTLADEHDDLDRLVEAAQELLRAVAQGAAVFAAEVEAVEVLERVAVDEQQDERRQRRSV